MAVIQPDTLEGMIGPNLWFHLDVRNDVLYLRHADRRATPNVGEETDEGDVLLYDEENRDIVGITILNWWRRFGQGNLPDSIRQIGSTIEPLASRLAA